MDRHRPAAWLLVAAFLLASGCGYTAQADEDSQQPATVEAVSGSDVSRIVLSADAAHRIGLATAPVSAVGAGRTSVPYSAVIYWIDGRTWVYAQEGDLTFLREPVDIDEVRGSRAILKSGPPAGTVVVKTGGVELLGTEFEIEGE
jgi:hypothetical protein